MKELTPDEVRSFQQGRGLTVTGLIDEVTSRALEEARWKLGDRSLHITTPSLMHGDDVATLQNRLVEMGFDCGRVDGVYGTRTSTAVSEFQKSVGVTVDGKCGPATIIALLRLTTIVSGGAPIRLREDVSQKNRGPALADKVIVLDPSNGGKNRGVTGFGIEEAEIVYDIAQRLEGRLLALGVSVFLTRGKDNCPTQQERVDLANKTSADLVISFHVDRYQNQSAHGVATYYYGSDMHSLNSVVGERFA